MEVINLDIKSRETAVRGCEVARVSVGQWLVANGYCLVTCLGWSPGKRCWTTLRSVVGLVVDTGLAMPCSIRGRES